VLAAAAANLDAHGARRLEDHNYGLNSFKARFNTRASAYFESDDQFHRRLFEHESTLAADRLQSFLVSLQPEFNITHELTSSMEGEADVTIDAIVGGDLLMHGTILHADALRKLPEVRKVVPLLPELKVSPHFEEMLPKEPTVALNVRIVPWERHAHLRDTAEKIAKRFTSTLLTLCTSDEHWRHKPSCMRAAASHMHVRAESKRLLVLEGVVPEDALALGHQLAIEAETIWIEPHAFYLPLNADAVMLTQSGSTPVAGPGGNAVGTTPIWDMGLHGEGEVIGVGDSGLDTGHCFFEEAAGQTAAQQTYSANHRKVVNYRAYADGGATGTDDHGTHVVGSILGKSSNPNAVNANEKGPAYEAKVSFTDIGNGNARGLSVPNDLVNNFFNVDYDNGARIHSNSWGATINAYTGPTADVDEFMHTFDDMVILFAAGNDGTNGPGTIGAPATCKNCLTVGASENDDKDSTPATADGNMAFFSSQGPARGGRYKPDVSAPGYYVSSANSNVANQGDCPLTEMAGTSMATPVTAGDVALIRQYFREGYFPTGTKNGGGATIPSGALLKALTVHSSVAMQGTYQNNQQLGQVPDNLQGFGRVQLNNILFPASSALTGNKGPADRLMFMDDASKPIGNNEEHEFIIKTNVNAGATLPIDTQLKVTLVWTDPPAQPLAQNPLINNLDLVLESPGASVNTGTACLAPLGCAGNGQPDNANTVEQVVVTLPPGAAENIIRVKGTNIQQGALGQKYALVVTGPLNVIPPPPKPPSPPPPKPPKPPGTPMGDVVALGISIPLLALAVGAGGCFICRGRKSSGSGAPYGAYNKPGAQSGLPDGWRMMVDPSSGHQYYYNDKNGESQWEKPAGVGSASAPSLPPGWTTGVDPQTNRTYYYNPTTNATSWVPPTA